MVRRHYFYFLVEWAPKILQLPGFLASIQKHFADRLIPVFLGLVLGDGAPVEVPKPGRVAAAVVGDFTIAFVGGVHGLTADSAGHRGAGGRLDRGRQIVERLHFTKYKGSRVWITILGYGSNLSVKTT